MKHSLRPKKSTLVLLATFVAHLQAALAQGTAFTYQGRLYDGANPANGRYDLRFALFDAASAGAQQGGLFTNSAASVTNGLFTVTLDFGNQFPGTGRWLETAVRTNGAAVFFVLSPRQAVTPAPYAITAGTVVSGGLAAGTYSNALTLNNGANQISGAFAGNGANVTNVNAASLNGLAATNFWQLGGNNVAPGQFLGSTNNQPLELRVNTNRALRMEYAFDTHSGHGFGVNIIGGAAENVVSNGFIGNFIGGGGSSSNPNVVSGNFAAILGGAQNAALNQYTTVLGLGNTARGSGSTAMGEDTAANGQDSTAMGANTIASGFASTAMGSATTATGAVAMAMGFKTKATNDYATAMGYGTVAGGVLSTAMGTNSVASGFGSTAMGASTTASGFNSTAMGTASTATGPYSTAIGYSTHASADSAIAMGNSTTANGVLSTAMGYSTIAQHNGTFVWADGSSATAFSSTAANQFLLRATGNVGVNTNNPGATLDVNGSFRAGPGTTIFTRLQAGIAQMATDSSTVKTNFTFSFPVTYTAVPNVLVSGRADPLNPNADDTFAVSVRRVTTTNCTVNITRTDVSAGWGQHMQVTWIAWQ